MSADKAHTVLHALLDRLERLPARQNRPSQRAPSEFITAGAREAFAQVLDDAAKVGAISIAMGRREARHLIERVTLIDASKLYEFLKRTPRPQQNSRAVNALKAACNPQHEAAQDALKHVYDAWLGNERFLGLGHDRIDQAAEFIRGLDVTLVRDPMDRRDLRTYSGQAAGDTKLLERQSRRIVSYLKDIGRLDAILSDAEALAILGLEKFAQPVLISGPIGFGDSSFEHLVYVGIPPEQAPSLEATKPIRSVLTIENLASFNRHVREARLPGDIIVYTGGFPSRAVISTLTAITLSTGVASFHHWGDIDESGLKIALFLSGQLSVPVLPHLMTAELALRKGTRKSPIKFLSLPSNHEWYALACFLEGTESHFLEQELLDPIPTPAHKI